MLYTEYTEVIISTAKINTKYIYIHYSNYVSIYKRTVMCKGVVIISFLLSYD